MQNLNKNFATLDEFMSECIKMCPIVDVKDNVVYLKQVELNFLILIYSKIRLKSISRREFCLFDKVTF